MAYALFGDKESFERLVAEAKADNCTLQCLSDLTDLGQLQRRVAKGSCR